jgi:hypothetical protein
MPKDWRLGAFERELKALPVNPPGRYEHRLTDETKDFQLTRIRHVWETILAGQPTSESNDGGDTQIILLGAR